MEQERERGASSRRHGHEAERDRVACKTLRALTFLSPGIPAEFFESVCAKLARSLACEITLEVDSSSSGPMRGDCDPFAEGRADLGFVCSPSYIYLRAQTKPSVELVPAGFVFDDPRAAGAAVYFSDVIVRADHAAQSFLELADGVWGYNDECSLSGYFSAIQRLSELGCGGEFFRQRVRTGSHQASIEATLNGTIDAAAIDSTVLNRIRLERPELGSRLRVLDSWGPWPIQPVVLRRELAPLWSTSITKALLELDAHEPSAALDGQFGLLRCAPITDDNYDNERHALRALGLLSPG